MKLKLLFVCGILLSSVAEPKKVKKRGAPLGTILHNLYELFALIIEKTGDTLQDTIPLLDELGKGNPVYSEHLHSIITTISDFYNSNRFIIMTYDLKDFSQVFMKPIMSTDDKCVKMAKKKVAVLLHQTESHLATTIGNKIIKIDELIKVATTVLGKFWDMIKDASEDVIENGKRCEKKKSAVLIQCLSKALIPFLSEIDSIVRDPELVQFFPDLLLDAREIVSMDGSLKDMGETLMTDVWGSYVFCRESRYKGKKYRKSRSFPMLQ